MIAVTAADDVAGRMRPSAEARTEGEMTDRRGRNGRTTTTEGGEDDDGVAADGAEGEDATADVKVVPVAAVKSSAYVTNVAFSAAITAAARLETDMAPRVAEAFTASV